ncbi:TrmH family RNA methyltransferase [Timonella sp. A28]|uniref:TrmH family RNA methyltransferase n=1 Tax=Timonella sp. A28 TaxID=3442640 RepID=UPI003EBBDEED
MSSSDSLEFPATPSTLPASADDVESEPEHVVGVGPWPGGEQEWPRDEQGVLDPRFDAELLREGDRRNVIDQYRYWTMDAIIADLDEHRRDLHIAIENWGHDLNIGSVVRTANAFAVKEVHIIGKRRWNRRGAMVTDRYQHVRHHETAEEFAKWAQAAGLAIIGIDNIDGSIPIEGYRFPKNCVLVFGQEKSGLTPQAQSISEDILHITQFGSTRSINAGAAAAIAMHSWIVQHADIP